MSGGWHFIAVDCPVPPSSAFGWGRDELPDWIDRLDLEAVVALILEFTVPCVEAV